MKRSTNITIFCFVSFSGGARSNLSTSHFVSPIFSLFLVVVVVIVLVVVSVWCNFYLLASHDKFQTVLRSHINGERSGLTLGYTCYSILGTSYCLMQSFLVKFSFVFQQSSI